MKEITIQIPEGKQDQWVNGVLTLVDEPNEDNRPVTERIKTFVDALAELNDRAENGDEKAGDLLADYESNAGILCKETLAYMRLSIITYALNEGWTPKFEKDERRYFPWFTLYTKEEYDKLDEYVKERCVLRSGRSTSSYYGIMSVGSNYDASYSYSANFGSRLAYRTRELAEYAGKQFLEEWADFMF